MCGSPACLPALRTRGFSSKAVRHRWGLAFVPWCAEREGSGEAGAAVPTQSSPCDLYGAEHLVRLFVKLPELVPVAYMTPPVSELRARSGRGIHCHFCAPHRARVHHAALCACQPQPSPPPPLSPPAHTHTPPAQDVVRLEQQLHDLMSGMTSMKRQARLFSLPEEYQPNPHFNPLLTLPLQTLLTAGGQPSGGTPGLAHGAAGAPPVQQHAEAAPAKD